MCTTQKDIEVHSRKRFVEAWMQLAVCVRMSRGVVEQTRPRITDELNLTAQGDIVRHRCVLRRESRHSVCDQPLGPLDGLEQGYDGLRKGGRKVRKAGETVTRDDSESR